MMIKKYLFLFIPLILIAGVLFYKLYIPRTIYRLNVIEFSDGWGYEIDKNDKPYIIQEYIPAIEGYHRFPSKYAAKKTGQLVVKKLKENKLPLVTEKEISEIENSEF